VNTANESVDVNEQGLLGKRSRNSVGALLCSVLVTREHPRN